MSDMDPCPACGAKVEATGAPLFGWRCPQCRYVWLAKPKEELNAEELRALLVLAEENIEFEAERADKAKVRIAELEAYIKKMQPMIDAYLAPGMSWNGKWVNDRAEEAEAALLKIKESYEARSELFTSDADCAANLAAWAEKALKP